MARQQSLAGLRHVGEARWGAAEGTNAENPGPIREVPTTVGEVRVQHRAQRAARQEGNDLRGQANTLLESRRPDPAPCREQHCRGDLPRVPLSDEAPNGVLVSAELRQELERGAEWILEVGRGDTWLSFRKKWNLTTPSILALVSRPQEGLESLARPTSP